MFESLSDKLDVALKNVKGQGRINELNIAETMREVRRALLDADVNYQVARDFTDKVKEQATDESVLTAVSPGPAVRQDPLRRARLPPRRRPRRSQQSEAAADGDPRRRAPGLGQDDVRRQARASTSRARAAARSSPPPTSTGPAAVDQLETLAEADQRPRLRDPRRRRRAAEGRRPRGRRSRRTRPAASAATPSSSTPPAASTSTRR